MKTPRIHRPLLFTTALAFAFLSVAMIVPLAHAANDDEASRIGFSNPSEPGTLKVFIKMGEINIAGTDTPDVVVHTDVPPDNAPPRKDGLRVISAHATFSLTEKDNVITLDTGDEGWPASAAKSEFTVMVPRNTHLVVSNGLGGEVTIKDISGDIEVKSLNAEVNLQNIAGGVLVETMNGEISANITQLHDDKPLSLTSMNGEIDLHVPADAKASIRLRSQNGNILTDFDEKALVTSTKAMRRKNLPRHHSSIDSEIKTAVRDAVRAGVEAAREAAEVVREAAQAAREAAQEVHYENMPIPLPPVPAMTGGRLVSGVLNGGEGPDIYVTAMNGDITLRKVE